MSGTGDITQGSLSQRAVDFYTDALTRHYGEPVRPVSQYCKALEDFVGALIANETNGPYNSDVGAAIREHGPLILTFARKSNLLARLIYGGQKLRTRKCPQHDGRWSGYGYGSNQCACQDGPDLTGWLA